MRTNPGVLAIAAVTAVWLGGCSSQMSFSDRAGQAWDRAGQAWENVKDPYVAPRKFAFLRCPDIATRLAGSQAREAELRNLMDRSGSGMGGSAINFVVYEPEYQGVLSEIQQEKDMLAEKNCPPPPEPKVEVKPAPDTKKPGKTSSKPSGSKTASSKGASDKTGTDRTGTDSAGAPAKP